MALCQSTEIYQDKSMINSKVAIITGAAKGIGRETALRFAQEGYCLTLVDIDGIVLEELKSFITEKYDVEAIACVGDLAVESFLQLIVFQTISHFSGYLSGSAGSF